MAYRAIFLVLLTITFVYCADHDTYKDCSRVEFCSNLRSREPADIYLVDSSSITVNNDNNILTVTLNSNTESSNLLLTLSGLHPDTFRLKISELNSSRYELQEVLNEEPVPINFDAVEITEDHVTVLTESNVDSVKINFSPFTIEFSKNNVTEIVFDGTRLILTQNDNNAPFAFGLIYPEAVQLYGLHEHCDTLALQNTAPGGVDPYRLKNSDVGGYEINSTMALYGAIPVLYGHGPRATAGVFLHNAAEEWIDIDNREDGNSRAYFMVDTGSLDLFVLLGQKPEDVVRQYLTLTGTAHLPQLWTLGYHQSRYSYDSQDFVKDVISNFDSNNFQLDAIWLDIDYTDAFKYFTWNPNTFSDPVGLQETIASTNKKLVTIIDPHIKVDNDYSVYSDALSEDLFVKNPDGTVFQGSCWPGLSSWLDYLNPEARDYYGNMYHYDRFVNSTPTLAGIWNDMNEPSVFDNSLEMTLPPDSLHFGGVKHREIHNIFGLLHTKSTHQGLLSRDDGTKRPFVLTRSHFAGTQRYSAIWTGDNAADWPYLLASFQECLNSNMLGIVFCGSDVGGFFQNPNDEQYQRWYQAGTWLPFFRAHSNKDTDRREPYVKSEQVQEVVRKTIQTRYKHLPVWYTLFYEHVRDKVPVIRPLFYQYPEDVNVYKIDDQLLVGRDILVRAVHEPGTTSVRVYFPGGSEELWVDVEKGVVFAGNGFTEVPVDIQSIPVYYRRGSVIARKETVRRNTAEMVDDGYTLYVTLDADNRAYGTIYVDDYVSFNYRDSQDYRYMSITFTNNNEVTFSDIDGSGGFPITIETIVYIEIAELPTGSKPGKYVKKIHTRDSSGKLLKDIIINPKKKTTLKLE